MAHMPVWHRMTLVGRGTLAATIVLLAGCASDTLFESDFTTSAVGTAPTATQKVGTAQLDGPAGSVVVGVVPNLPGKWVSITRADPNGPVVGFQGNFSAFKGNGQYNFVAHMFIPTGAGVATIQFERFGQPVSGLQNFLHIDFTQDNHVRIDDDSSTTFGTVPRDKPFIVQVTLNIGDPSTAHIVLAGDGADGMADRTIAAPFANLAKQFGAVRVWMGSPHTGTFNATNIVVTKRRD